MQILRRWKYKRVGPRSQLTRVEIAGQVATAVVSDFIEAVAEVVKQPFLSKYAAAFPDPLSVKIDVVGHVGRQVAAIAFEQFEYTIVSANHPVCSPSHYSNRFQHSTKAYPCTTSRWEFVAYCWEGFITRQLVRGYYGASACDASCRRYTGILKSQKRAPMIPASARTGSVIQGDATMLENDDAAVNGFESSGKQRYSHIEFDDGTCAITDLDAECESFIISDLTVADTEVERQ